MAMAAAYQWISVIEPHRCRLSDLRCALIQQSEWGYMSHRLWPIIEMDVIIVISRQHATSVYHTDLTAIWAITKPKFSVNTSGHSFSTPKDLDEWGLRTWLHIRGFDVEHRDVFPLITNPIHGTRSIHRSSYFRQWPGEHMRGVVVSSYFTECCG